MQTKVHLLFFPPFYKIVFTHSRDFPLNSTTITQNPALQAQPSCSWGTRQQRYFCQYISTIVIWTAAGYSFGFSEPHIFFWVFEGRQAGRQAEWFWCVDVWWEAGRGSCCSSPWEEGHSERMSREGPFRRSLSQSEWGGIRILLGRCACCPAIMAEINGSAALDRRYTCPALFHRILHVRCKRDLIPLNL